MRTPNLTLTAAAFVSLTLAACGTQVKTLPLPPVTSATTTNATATTGAASDVAIYFSKQPHADVAHRLGDASHSVRIARSTDGAEASCNKALADALDKLRADAKQKGANAVIDVTTRFHTSATESATEYTCGVSTSAAAIAVKGDLVILQAH
ncbi:hypothetical protein C7405_101125 [Paraburkholderia caballeronis]|uniref:signal peptidase n=1 Tax=Paraburkholderia caballeronis TaxID=416943 RepID=UPI00106697E9|nr:signal peptidase [Paraburkholderia caballeronis]TDV39008.1 hypothetical protein C7405_101125 [Paraburkholderia caballeronis]